VSVSQQRYQQMFNQCFLPDNTGFQLASELAKPVFLITPPPCGSA
jgi:hypothetical protein